MQQDATRIERLWKPGYTNLHYDLPPTVRSIRDSWQITFQSAAVVSGLLAGAAAQLYGFFKDPGSYSETTSTGRQDAMVALCYIAMFLNIGATLSGFIIIDALGEIQYRAATLPPHQNPPIDDVSNYNRPPTQQQVPQLLKRYSRGLEMDLLVQHWFFSFIGGIVSLLVLIVVYIAIEERVALKVVAAILTFYIALPALYWVWQLLKDAAGSRNRQSAATDAGAAPAHIRKRAIPDFGACQINPLPAGAYLRLPAYSASSKQRVLFVLHI